MPFPIRLRKAAFTLLLTLLSLLLLWLALPRLLGLLAERWLDIPGVEAVHVDIEKVGTGRARLRDVRATYRSAAGHRFQLALRDIALDYSLTRRHIEVLDIGSGELEISPGQTLTASPWPLLEWPMLPVSAVRIDDLRVVVNGAGSLPLEVRGTLDLRQSDGQLQGELRPDSGVLRVTASQPRIANEVLDVHVEWLPAAGSPLDARLSVGRQPTQQPARLVARMPLPVLEDVARALGVAVPLSAARGAITLTAEALLGETAWSARAVSGDAEFNGVSVQTEATVVPVPLTLSLAGKVRFAWQPFAAQLEVLPAAHWQMTAGPSLRASGRLGRAFTIHRNDGVSIGEGEFPFSVQSDRWGRWDGAVRRFVSSGGRGVIDVDNADVELRIKGRLAQWQRDAIQVSGLQASGDVALRWSRSAAVRSEMDLQLGVERVSWSGNPALTVNKSEWQLHAEAQAKVEDFWKSLTINGDASSPRLKVDLLQDQSQRDGERQSLQTLTFGPSRVQLLQLHPFRSHGTEGEVQLSVDTLRFGTWPAPDARARLHLDGRAVRADGMLLLQGVEVLRFTGAHGLASGCGEVELSASHGLPALGKLLQPRPATLSRLDLRAGKADARFALDWCARPTPRLDARGTLRMSDATLGWEQARIEATQSTLQVDGLHPLRGRLQLAAQRAELATGTSLTDLNVDVTLAARSLTVGALGAQLLGGSLRGGPLVLPWPLSDQPLPVEIYRIDLGQLLGLFNVQGLAGSGQLDGVLPLAYRDGSLAIHDGRLNSLGAGTLKYAPTLALPDNPGLQALRNFHYKYLGLGLEYAPDGAYRVQAKLEGNNPDFYSGYPIRFGLNINGALPGLFRAALFSGDFNRHILEQLQSGKLE